MPEPDKAREQIAELIWQGVKDSEGEFTLGFAIVLAREILPIAREGYIKKPMQEERER